MRDDWSDRIESLLVGGSWVTSSCVAAIIGAIVGVVAAYLIGLPMWATVVVFAVGFGLGTFVLLRALDAEESRNQP